MSKNIKNLISFLSLMIFASAVAVGQTVVETKKTEVVRNPDGTYTVIEYPVDKEVTVNLVPGVSGLPGKGTARVMRTADGTKVYLDVAGVPSETKGYYAYAVDPSGTPTLLGPLTFENGVAKGEFTTPMNQFMVVLSSEGSLTTIDPTTMVYASEVPTGYAIVPRRKTSDNKAVARAETVASAYEVPLLGVPSFNGKTTEVRVRFDGELQGLDGKAYLNAGKGKTQVKMRFSDMKKAPMNKRYVLWASSPDGKYTKIGQVVNTGRGDESEIRGETALADFGLLVTVEDVDVNVPTSKIYSVFTVAPAS